MFARLAIERMNQHAVLSANVAAIGANVGFSGDSKPLKRLASDLLGHGDGHAESAGLPREFVRAVSGLIQEAKAAKAIRKQAGELGKKVSGHPSR